MGDIASHSPVLLVLVAFSRYGEDLDWARERACEAWGPVGLASEAFAFEETDYYEPTMGADLRKVFWAFEDLISPERLIEVKLQTNQWEAECAALARREETRPLNLDPGYLSLAKLVLASTKDHAHRLYLGQGIYGEVTLHYHKRQWQHREWTFPDYRRSDYHQFLTRCREYLKDRRLTSTGGSP